MRNALGIARTLLLPSSFRRAYATAGTSQFLKISDEVKAALSESRPVVALESAIYTHGFPYPDNLKLAKDIEKTVRKNGAVPATVCVLNGKAIIGLSQPELEQMADGFGKKGTVKVSRRDLAYVAGLTFNSPSRNFVGGTTIAGTSVLAHMAGIRVFATGGLGGVHKGAEKTMDVSADLTELGRTPIAVISSGAKAFLDLEKTLEFLETQGVYVAAIRDKDSTEPVQLPAFYSRGAGVKAPSVVNNAKEAAAIIYASHSMNLTSGQFFANPIPKEYEIPHEEIKGIIDDAVKSAESKASGADVTPFILNDILERTQGRSVEANRHLIINNVAMGAKIAVELAQFEGTPSSIAMPHLPLPAEQSIDPARRVAGHETGPGTVRNPDVLVVGGVAVDVSCNYVPPSSTPTPALHTSNPSRITESLGGVANNVAYAMHLSGTKAKLISCVGADIAGRWVLEQVRTRGMDTSGIATSKTYSTARYVAVNDSSGGLFIASADMEVIDQMFASQITSEISSSGAGWVCIDGNLSGETIVEVLRYCSKREIKVVFEPTSAAKSTLIFHSPKALPVFPNTAILAAPNTHELDAMYLQAQKLDFFSTGLPWWAAIDALNVDGRFRDSLSTVSHSAGMDLIGTGTLQKAIHLAPYIPNLFIKLGGHGCLVVKLLEEDDALLRSTGERGMVVQKAREGTGMGGIYIKHFQPEKVGKDGMVSVNGAGDTFLGVLVGGLVKGDELEGAVERAQRAAVLTLASREAVSERIRELV